MQKKIKAKVTYQNLGTGFWGLIDNSGKEYRPVNMPEQIKKDGEFVQVTIREVEEGMSIFMWGTAVEIVGFHTLG